MEALIREDDCFLIPFALKTREIAYTEGFSQPSYSPETAMLFLLFGCTNPPPLSNNFWSHRRQNQSPKDIAKSYITNCF